MLNSRLHPTVILAARSALGVLRSEDKIAWAEAMLDRGLDSKNLRILAGLLPIDGLVEVDDRFERAMNELGFEMPDPEAAAHQLAAEIAGNLLRGTITPYECVDRISEIYCALGFPSKYAMWDELAEIAIDLRVGSTPAWLKMMSPKRFSRVVSDEAKKIIESVGVDA